MKIIYELERSDLQYIDVRTPKEFRSGHILGAVNLPLFTDEAHAVVGTLYKQKGEVAAKIKGMAFVGERLADIYESFLAIEMQAKAQGKKVALYCARGGMRSGSLEHLLMSLGHEIYRLDGGYKQYRQVVLSALEEVIPSKKWIVLHGMTGSGKTQVLHYLRQLGESVIDIEGICSHRGSMLGRIGLPEQPSQKNFEHLLLEALQMAKSPWVWIEAESKRLGRNTLPETLMEAMKQGRHVNIEAQMPFRIKTLLAEYAQSESCIKEIHGVLEGFRKTLGHKAVDQMQTSLLEGDLQKVALYLMREYYDPKYRHASRETVCEKTFIITDAKEMALALSKWIREVN